MGLVASLPLLALYEIGILLTGSPVENHVSALVKRMIAVLGGNAYLIVTAAVAGLFVIALIAKRRGPAHDFHNYLVIIVEAGVYAVLLGAGIYMIGVPLAAGLFQDGDRTQEFLGLAILYMGAGVWEELFFRLVLLGGFLFFTVRHLGGHPMVFSIVGLLLSSAAFSAIHHLGNMGEPFVSGVFLFRMMAGLILGVLYLSRGLGVCVYTHAFYNVGLLLISFAATEGQS
ncbi:MAG: CPBP family intramembrane glutamic endopeptidase [Planctomycetota bacterium]